MFSFCWSRSETVSESVSFLDALLCPIWEELFCSIPTRISSSADPTDGLHPRHHHHVGETEVGVLALLQEDCLVQTDATWECAFHQPSLSPGTFLLLFLGAWLYQICLSAWWRLCLILVSSKVTMASIHLYFAGKQVGDTQKRGKPEMRSSCRKSLDLPWSASARPGRGPASVPHLRYLSVSRHFNE